MSRATKERSTPDPLENLWLELAADEFVHYTIREVKGNCPVTLVMRAKQDSEFTVSCGDAVERFALIASSDTASVHVLTLPEGDEFTIKVAVSAGILQIAEVHFDLPKAQ
jgi:hypothetical protein